MLVNTEKMVPVGKLQKELTQKLREVSETGEPLYILRNNEMATVILSAAEYEFLGRQRKFLSILRLPRRSRKG
jgi:PHD/YefM family antitoxin component YafN of YafNO toxin-antitoxin module